jgi:hypothetical protein
LYLVAIVLSVLWCTDSEYPFGILWPLCCLSFDVRILSTHLVSCSHCQRTDNTMARRYQRGTQNRTSKDRQHNGHKAIVLSVLWCTDSEYPFGILWPLCCLSFDVRILSTPLVSCSHCVVCPLSKDRKHNGHKIPKGYSEFVHQRTDNTMATRYQRGTQNPYIKGQKTQWPQDTKGVLVSCGHCVVCPLLYGFWVPIWNLVVIVLSVLWCTDSEYPFGILWPLCCLSFDVRILSTHLAYCGHCVVCWESVHQRRDNTMATRYQRGTQNPYIKGQTTQWPQDNNGGVRVCTSENRKHNVLSWGHCVVCPLMYGFWVPLWYLVAIVLSVLWCTEIGSASGSVRA